MKKTNSEILVMCIFDECTVQIFDNAYFKMLAKIAIVVDKEGIELFNRITMSFILLTMNVSSISHLFNESSRNVIKIKTSKF